MSSIDFVAMAHHTLLTHTLPLARLCASQIKPKHCRTPFQSGISVPRGSAPNRFDQVARIARRGRKRYLGLVFITQLPSHLPDEVFGLINNWILHKITDTNVVQRLRKVVPAVNESTWSALPNLPPGQALASFTHLTRPIMTAVDPSPCQLRMVD
jgi:hypothetical protein